MISVERLTKSYDSAGLTLRGVSFDVGPGEVYTLLGPSGCGKTTSLRCVAGLEQPASGRIALNGRTVFSSDERINLSPDRRRIGMVFQSYAVWPHMTVAQNVAYPIENKRLGAAEVARRVDRALELVGLAGFGDRPSPNLSGGQQQRVALARAIVAEPEVLLFDEPLSNLDAKLREQMRRELTELQRQLGRSVLYVTHDQEEALAISDKIALMRAGVIIEEGSGIEMYQHPRHPFTAMFLGAANFIGCRLPSRPREGERIEVETAFGRFAAVARLGEESAAKLFFRPHHATALAEGLAASPAGLNVGRGRVGNMSFLGEVVEIELHSGDERIRLRISGRPAVEPGAEVLFAVDPDYSIAFFPELAGS